MQQLWLHSGKHWISFFILFRFTRQTLQRVPISVGYTHDCSMNCASRCCVVRVLRLTCCECQAPAVPLIERNYFLLYGVLIRVCMQGCVKGTAVSGGIVRSNARVGVTVDRVNIRDSEIMRCSPEK